MCANSELLLVETTFSDLHLKIQCWLKSSLSESVVGEYVRS